ncbi:hypothetical protein ES319_D07G206900v1 [Gossypium barbadense]|uniref:Fumarylacetoacetase n=1 Tax=Gossypium barbadense TaxID=3634 RepID=A0A5J5QT82_GOSBA|nr:hypothetical protein ES319_D07G206900v1 [Gossypium barbadense]
MYLKRNKIYRPGITSISINIVVRIGGRPPPNGHLVDCNNITARFSFAPITPIGCNSHSPHSAPIRDSIPVSYFLFQFLPSSTSSSQTFPFHIASSLTSRYITLLAARTLPLFILQVQIKPSGQTDSCMVTRSNLKNLYWIVTQQVAHHTINGCNLRPGDLLRTGTISGEMVTMLVLEPVLVRLSHHAIEETFLL